MKKLLYIITLSISLNSFKAQTSPTGLNVNDVAPDYTAVDQHGKTINLKQLVKFEP